ncbi:uncharacterized protein ASCRUDRAFT_82543 [Ascoidea rubescens DSM 1968]|uniref:Uncharacterized protein n=1 Tax=Ascoidea rubescens DSM 1968 TaxID=1344418 RepID=A0A1D2VBD3_9ASCO|nr:hypothetical protein ASCRUDRAFT_82543 [Ascoidea rubescens DSM 1968]ODV58910.1 hypothetical protein ASCRUDRAFT_82543 [Ascoidea rubescens DSM 1968]
MRNLSSNLGYYNEQVIDISDDSDTDTASASKFTSTFPESLSSDLNTPSSRTRNSKRVQFLISRINRKRKHASLDEPFIDISDDTDTLDNDNDFKHRHSIINLTEISFN